MQYAEPAPRLPYDPSQLPTPPCVFKAHRAGEFLPLRASPRRKRMISHHFNAARAGARAFALLAAAVSAGTAGAAQLDIAGPSGSVAFGRPVYALPNGNIVVVDSKANGVASDVGAVYLYSPTGTLISTLTGSTADDRVGYGGVVVLANGNFVVLSPNWSNGAANFAGAVTWVDGTTGLSGAVSATNSLVGSSALDR